VGTHARPDFRADVARGTLWTMSGLSGADTEQETGQQVRALAVESARQIRALLAELADPAAELTASAATRTSVRPGTGRGPGRYAASAHVDAPPPA
jgi:hypothetical protein